MQHLVDTAKRTGAAFHVLSEVAQAPRDGERTADKTQRRAASELRPQFHRASSTRRNAAH
jgi:hypothetical protein